MNMVKATEIAAEVDSPALQHRSDTPDGRHSVASVLSQKLDE